MKTELVALKGRLYTKSFQLVEGQKLVIGRGLETDIQILDTGLSRRHCCLEKCGDEFFLSDLGSRNGTWLNGKRVQREPLKSGDKISIGGVEFVFRTHPERRRMHADIVASVPEKPGREFKERVSTDRSDLWELPPKHQNVESYRRVQRDLATIYRVGNLINAEPDLRKLYDCIIDSIFRVVKADRGLLLIEEGAAGRLKTVAKLERKPAPEDQTAPGFSTTIVQECYKEGTSILRANAMTDERFGRAESVLFQNIHSVVCVPVETPERVIGAIYADTVAEGEAFMKHDLELLAAVGKQAGIAIERSQLSERLRELLYGTVRTLVAAIEAKDEYTRGHSERVTIYALQIGTAMAFNEAQLRTLELAGLLHDVGKIGIPENILRKAGPLTDEEYNVVKQHPSLGEGIIRNIEGANEIAEIVRHHHERWDGKGYPDGLAEDAPSLLARVLSVADAFDAMSSARPYRDHLAEQKVLSEITRCAGTQFDPTVAEVFFQEMEAGRIAAEEESSVDIPTPGREPGD